MSWKDCLGECATIFHYHVNMFMYKHILNDNGILGKVKEYVIRYEYNIMDSCSHYIMGSRRKFNENNK